MTEAPPPVCRSRKAEQRAETMEADDDAAEELFFKHERYGVTLIGKLGSVAQTGVMAEREGFEPSIRFCRILTFQASAFDHSATAPHFVCAWTGRALRGLRAG